MGEGRSVAGFVAQGVAYECTTEERFLKAHACKTSRRPPHAGRFDIPIEKDEVRLSQGGRPQ